MDAAMDRWPFNCQGTTLAHPWRKWTSASDKKRSPLIDRRNFQHRDQLEGETVDSYFAALSRLHEACDFEDKHNCSSCYQDCDYHEVTANIRLRDRFILGLGDTDMQQEVMKEHYDQNLSLEQVLQICLAYKSRCLHESTERLFVSALPKASYRKELYAKPREQIDSCPYCGESKHPRDECPASRQQCRSCGKFGRIMKMRKFRSRVGLRSMDDHEAEDDQEENTVILHIIGVVLFSVVNDFTKIKKTPK